MPASMQKSHKTCEERRAREMGTGAITASLGNAIGSRISLATRSDAASTLRNHYIR